mmetsp:Transcript_170132/g.545590  ORF Transcript_170132/g.545590 Transcript_170132/m.545590 type:complete len:295 (+) Transcript_170132:437-1321(+)
MGCPHGVGRDGFGRGEGQRCLNGRLHAAGIAAALARGGGWGWHAGGGGGLGEVGCSGAAAPTRGGAGRRQGAHGAFVGQPLLCARCRVGRADPGPGRAGGLPRHSRLCVPPRAEGVAEHERSRTCCPSPLDLAHRDTTAAPRCATPNGARPRATYFRGHLGRAGRGGLGPGVPRGRAALFAAGLAGGEVAPLAWSRGLARRHGSGPSSVRCDHGDPPRGHETPRLRTLGRRCGHLRGHPRRSTTAQVGAAAGHCKWRSAGISACVLSRPGASKRSRGEGCARPSQRWLRAFRAG